VRQHGFPAAWPPLSEWISTMFARSALWRDRDFVQLWTAQAISAFGARITREGLPITAVIGLGASPLQVGLLAAFANGPALVVGLAGGGFVDRRRRRGVMVFADLARAAVLATVPLAALMHLLTPAHLFLAAALVGVASVLFEIADHAYLPALVRRCDLTAANASLTATESVAEIAGPAVAGVLFQALTAPFAVTINAVTYLVSALFLGRIRRPEAPPEPDPHARWTDDIARGFGAAWDHPLVRPLLLMTACQGLFGGFFSANYIIFCLRTVGLPTSLLGLTIAAGGVGALAGASVAGRMSRRLGLGPSILIAAALYGAALLLVPLAPSTPTVGMAVLVAAQLVGDAFAVAAIVLATSLRQTVLPIGMLGRVGALFRAASGGLMVVGALAGGLLGERLGVRPTLWIGASGILVAALLALPSPLRRLREMPEAA
jgi:predicted MFS family arabinose efflux permease